MLYKIIIGATLTLTLGACDAAQDTAAPKSDAERLADDMERYADNLEAMASEATAMVAAQPLSANQARSVCKAAIAQMFGHSPKIMTATGDDVTRVTYRRPDDGKTFTNDCRIEGNKIIWRSVNAVPGSGPGPWRTHDGDEVFTFKIEGKTINITTTYSDGSVTTEPQPLV